MTKNRWTNAKFEAQVIVSNCAAAYWLYITNQDKPAEFLRGDTVDALRDLAAKFGYDLVAAKPATEAPTITTQGSITYTEL